MSVLQALVQHYETLCARGELSVPGWVDNFKVTFGLDLSEEGELLRVIDLRVEQQKGKKTVIAPCLMRVPEHFVRSGNSVPSFLCDNAAYLLGVEEEGPTKKSLKHFASTKSLHTEILSEIDEPAARAVVAFLTTWQPDEATNHPALTFHWETIVKGVNLIFCYEGKPVSELESIQDAWQAHYDVPDPFAPKGECLVTGNIAPIAVTHPKIKGVKGAQSTGASLVSFNCPSFCSYGKSQNLNAPISERSAFAYTSALNALLSDRAHSRYIGDMVVVCWAEHGDPSYQDAYMKAMFGSTDSDEQGILSTFLYNLEKGRPLTWDGKDLDEHEHFYILGISPNSARLSIRFFYEDSFGPLLQNIRKHFEDIAIEAPTFDTREYLSLGSLLYETVNKNASDKSPLPHLPGNVLRAILTGCPYPVSLLNGAYQRILSEKDVNRGKAAIIKAYYSRAGIQFPKEVLTLSLNENSTSVPYTLGRLFYVLEHLQEEAIPGINASIRDKYLTSAAATPARVFTELIRRSSHHLRKLTAGSRTFFEKQIGQLMGNLNETFPSQLSMEERSAFYLGYYHQRQYRFTPKNNKTMEE